ncbi:MAG TPA: hypothetical protein PLP34_03920 [Chitinophagaceae bacterium]|nr:hypothetical protein [Chitinophagaceae bacterium]HNF71534.1 hypothetical protein [Chitinophagaceae bacterium]
MFDKALYLKSFAVVLGATVLALIISYFYFGEVTVVDTIGSVISASIVAFMAQLFILMKRHEQ